ncbi:MAG: DUF5680 domain-containing protein [bacterium]|nr:DUF5680 domain-containing protein [bacterium]
MTLGEFLVKAKVHTYASVGESGEQVFDNGGRELIFEDGGFRYRDIYFGFNPFVGEEIVWQGEKPIWGMNYYGQVLSNLIPPKDIYGFLKKALRKVTEEKPFRGPILFQEGGFEYKCKNEGDIARFVGLEEILYKGEEVYILNYHGGLIA